MKRYLTYFSVVAVALFAVSFLNADEAKETEKVEVESAAKKKLTKAERKEMMAKILKTTTCPISGGPVDATKTVAYKDSKVYMCCGKCVKAFDEKVKTDKTLAAKANHQLLVTKQARQVKCGLNGKGKLNKKTMTKFASTEVGFCCKNCQGKFTEMKDEEKVQLVFGKNFETAFVVKAEQRKKNKEKKAKAAKEKKAA